MVAFGAHPMANDGIPPDHPSIIVMHRFLGSWKLARPRNLLRFSVFKRFVLTIWHFFYPLCVPSCPRKCIPAPACCPLSQCQT